ncbi:hypothetical protein AUC61_11360 [Pseudomonas sp. S25]|uniref:Uncharacterized protein n=1 Tax=Pseudomonas maioricensis TaxID=1766623 RepID=A0ABS9ZHR2_9PSED|nr:hypothetical protein [Pseudomonas sp. S25]
MGIYEEMNRQVGQCDVTTRLPIYDFKVITAQETAHGREVDNSQGMSVGHQQRFPGAGVY